QPSEQTIFLSQSFRLGRGTRPQRQAIRSAPDQTATTTDNQMSLISGHRSDHAPTPTSDHRQNRPPDQISPQTTIHDWSSSNQHSTPNLVNGTEGFCSGLCNSRSCFQPAVVARPLTLGQVTPATRSEVGKLLIEVI
ncbi:unnamed protein product, partial [Porites evermanni]